LEASPVGVQSGGRPWEELSSLVARLGKLGPSVLLN